MVEIDERSINNMLLVSPKNYSKEVKIKFPQAQSGEYGVPQVRAKKSLSSSLLRLDARHELLLVKILFLLHAIP